MLCNNVKEIKMGKVYYKDGTVKDIDDVIKLEERKLEK